MKNNYFNQKPLRAPHVSWQYDANGLICLIIYNTGIFNKLAQILLKKPKATYVHLDELGSFVWLKSDGNLTFKELSSEFYTKFDSRVSPLHERLYAYVKILEYNNFIIWKN